VEISKANIYHRATVTMTITKTGIT
jgi:hypothetical protein